MILDLRHTKLEYWEVRAITFMTPAVCKAPYLHLAGSSFTPTVPCKSNICLQFACDVITRREFKHVSPFTLHVRHQSHNNPPDHISHSQAGSSLKCLASYFFDCQLVGWTPASTESYILSSVSVLTVCIIIPLSQNIQNDLVEMRDE